MRIGGLFEGYGGLTMGVQLALGGGELAWYSEHEPPTDKNPRPTQAPARLLAYRHPGVPNLGDITAVDWSQVEPVDVLCGGSPCQDVSTAGRRAGMRPGTRSGLWESMREAIATLSPRLVVWENVRGVTSACAHSELADCPRCVGGSGPHEPVLRALGRVLGDLAGLGFDAEWHGLRASDVGAPHERFRVFVVAYPHGGAWMGYRHALGQHRRAPATNPDGLRCERRRVTGDMAGSEGAGQADREQRQRDGNAADDCGPTATDTDQSGPQGGEPALGRDVPAWRAAADAESDGWDEGRAEPAGLIGRSDAAQRGASLATDTQGYTRRLSDGERVPPRQWGPYAPAIARWERTLGRVAPAPTEPNTKGGQRLSPAFVEWMMGLPGGHVTGPAIGLTRNEQLGLLGRGVVPQQAAAAIRICLARTEAVAA